jgi:hypothetical protein
VEGAINWGMAGVIVPLLLPLTDHLAIGDVLQEDGWCRGGEGVGAAEVIAAKAMDAGNHRRTTFVFVSVKRWSAKVSHRVRQASALS